MGRALIIINSDKDRDRAAELATYAPAGTRIEFKRSKRTPDQNALLWARLTEISQRVVWHGKKRSTNDWKDMFSASLRGYIAIPGIDPGSFVVLGMRTSDMSVEEMGQLLDLIDAFAAERGVVFQDSQEGAA